MATFTDNQGSEWTVHLDGYAYLQCKKIGIDINEIAKTSDDGLSLLQQIATDLELMSSLLWTCVESEFRKEGLGKDDLLRRLSGDAIEGATFALLEAIADFFPNAHHRRKVLLIIKKARAAAEVLVGLAEAKLTELDESLTPEMAAEIAAEASKISSTSAAQAESETPSGSLGES